MNKIFKKISSFVLACLLLLSTVSFTIEKHYCGRILVDVALFSEAKGCGMEMMMEDSLGLEVDMKKKSCCKDEITVIEGQNELKTSFDQIDFSQQIFIVSFIDTYFSMFDISEERNIGFTAYSPPDLVRDIQILHETFLI